MEFRNWQLKPAIETMDKILRQRFNATLHQRLNRNFKKILEEYKTLVESLNKLQNEHIETDDKGDKVPVTKTVKTRRLV
jgi:DNA anti-recombination protein RmuC